MASRVLLAVVAGLQGQLANEAKPDLQDYAHRTTNKSLRWVPMSLPSGASQTHQSCSAKGRSGPNCPRSPVHPQSGRMPNNLGLRGV